MSTENIKLDLTGAPPEALELTGPYPGDVYSKAGNEPGFWVIMSVRGSSCYVLAFDLKGEVTGATAYSRSYFLDRDHRYVGRTEVPSFVVEWEHTRRMRR